MTILTMFFTALSTALGMSRQPESDALRQTAPRYLDTQEKAAEHLAGATFAGELFSVDPALLLAIAFRESRYSTDVTGPDVGGRHACGLMQPLMHAEPCSEQTVLEGYVEGAKHLREWLDTKTIRGDLHLALLGYSGGYSLLNGCALGPVVVERNGKVADFCTWIPESIEARAELIRSHMKRAIGAS